MGLGGTLVCVMGGNGLVVVLSALPDFLGRTIKME